MRITDIRCENMPAEYDKKNCEIYCVNTDKPHFSFTVEGTGENAYVTHYKRIVSSSQELAADGVGDMYDTGSVKSSDICDIEYSGKPLYPRSVYYFRIFAIVDSTVVKSRICMFATGIGDVRRLRDHFICAADGFLQKYPEAEGHGGVYARIMDPHLFSKELCDFRSSRISVNIVDLIADGPHDYTWMAAVSPDP